MTAFSLKPTLRRLTAFFLLCGFTSFALADKIVLKNGKEFEGTIIEEDDDKIKIEIKVGTIKDKRTFMKVEIESMECSTPETADLDAVLKLLPTQDALTSQNYAVLMKKPQEFLEKYPNSQNREKVEAVLQSLEREKAKVDSGYLKFRSVWLDQTQRVAHQININAEAARRSMLSTAGRNLFGALRAYENMEKRYKGTLAYPKALDSVKKMIPAYGKSLQREIEYYKVWQEEQDKFAATLKEEAKLEYDRNLESEKKRFAAMNDREKKSGVIWLSVNKKDLSSLMAGIERAKKEAQRLEKIDSKPYAEQAELIYEAEELLAKKDLVNAEAKLEEALSVKGVSIRSSKSKSSKGAAEVVDRIQSKLADAKEQEAREQAIRDRLAEENKMKQQVLETIENPGEKLPEVPDSVAQAEGETEGSADDALAALLQQRQAEAAQQNAAKEKPSSKGQKSTKKKPRATTAQIDFGDDDGGGGGGFDILGIIKILVPLILVGVTGFLYMQKRNEGEE